MSEKSVFDFQDYKDYLNFAIELQPNGGRGFRKRMAEAMQCQQSLVSMALQKDGEVHLTPEQAERLNPLFNHSSEESKYFFFLVLLARVGTEKLRELLQEQLGEILQKRVVLKNRLENERKLPYECESRYYSTWYYQAIRCAVAVPELRTEEALSRRLKISRKKVREALDFLTTNELIRSSKDGYLPGIRHLQLANDSSMRIRTHTNWRLRCMASLDEERAADLHYSSVLTLSREDALFVKSRLVDAIEEVIKKIKTSPEETVYSFCTDFFEI